MAAIELILEEPCGYCDGKGYNSNFDNPIKQKINGELKTIGYERVKCNECGSTGYFLTDLGEQILSFVKKNLNRNLGDI